MRDDEPKPVVSSGLEDSLHVYNRDDCLALLCLKDIVVDASIQGVLQLRQRLLERATSYYAWARVYA